VIDFLQKTYFFAKKERSLSFNPVGMHCL